MPSSRAAPARRQVRPLHIPSISIDPNYASDVWRASEFVLDKLGVAGLAAELIETAGQLEDRGSVPRAPFLAPRSAAQSRQASDRHPGLDRRGVRPVTVALGVDRNKRSGAPSH